MARRKKVCKHCGHPEEKDRRTIVKTPNGLLCSNCIGNGCLALADEYDTSDAIPFGITEEEVIRELDRYVVGQTEAKEVLASEAVMHLSRIMSGDSSIAKNNVLMLGPTGCGKTLLARTLTQLLGLPYTIADMSAFSQSGYIGDSVASILYRLADSAAWDLERAEMGIIILDEIDKIAARKSKSELDIKGSGVQYELLKMLDGTVIDCDGGHWNEPLTIDTSNILFICCGAFTGLDDIIEKRVKPKRIGFGAEVRPKSSDNSDLLSRVIPEDLVKYGFIDEFAGRLQLPVALKTLSREQYTAALMLTDNSIVKQYQAYYKTKGIKLYFDKDAIEAIVDKAISQKTGGARSLGHIMSKTMTRVNVNVGKHKKVKKCTVTREVILESKEPKIIEDKTKTKKKKKHYVEAHG